ncbi:hypothetical protein ACIHFC_32905 [Streptomyces sp. NPDC052013]
MDDPISALTAVVAEHPVVGMPARQMPLGAAAVDDLEDSAPTTDI